MKKTTVPGALEVISPVIVRSKLSGQQSRYLNILASELRADPGDILLALAFGKIEADAGMGDDVLGAWRQSLREFVDRRKVPSPDPSGFNQWSDLGRATVEVMS